MIVIKRADQINILLEKARNGGISIGFVPTMGALHNGHISLIKQAQSFTKYCVCSIFVNPTQFNNLEDFKKYPITIENDIQLLEENGCDILFLPDASEIYPPNYQAPIYELGYLDTVLEGSSRPGHFQGVCQVVDRLLTIVKPDVLFLGQKDFQQCMVITKMIRETGHACTVQIGETLREKDGLAMSSRNMRLNVEERILATEIYKTLIWIKSQLTIGSLDQIKKDATKRLTELGFKVEYVEIADSDQLTLLNHWNGNSSLVILIAAFLNQVRLIDNLLIRKD